MQVKNNIFALSLCIGSLFAGMVTSCDSRQTASIGKELQIRKMSGFPEGEIGFNFGVSACYAGMIDHQMIMAGGCNFPEVPAADGGTKRFYKGIYAACITQDSILSWRKVGELPVSAAYGVSVSTPQGVICAGGTNAEGALNAVYRISLSDSLSLAKIETLPSLPCTLDNMGGSLLGSMLYITGGNVDGKPSNRLFCLDLGELSTGWQELPAFPGNPRVQPVCVGLTNNGEKLFYVWGGFAPYHDNQSATLAVDGYAYSPSRKEWMPVATPIGNDSIPISLGGGTAIAISDSTMMCMGGVNKDIFMSALQREEQIKKALAGNNQELVDNLKAISKKYMLQEPGSYQFNDRICIYNACRNLWKELLRTPATARAGAALVGNGEKLFSINGELKPGIRTPEIVEIVIQ